MFLLETRVDALQFSPLAPLSIEPVLCLSEFFEDGIQIFLQISSSIRQAVISAAQVL